MNSSEISGFTSASNITTASISRGFSNGSLVFSIDENFQKLITSNKNPLTIAIADLIISEDLPLNLTQKPRFKKRLEFSRKAPKTYITPNRKVISNEQHDFIHEQNMKTHLAMIKRKQKYLGCYF